LKNVFVHIMKVSRVQNNIRLSFYGRKRKTERKTEEERFGTR